MNEGDWMPFNINDHVRVRLTKRGRELNRKRYDELMAKWPGKPLYDYTPPKEDEKGWSEWQLWALMEEFGRHMCIGTETPFETEIGIATKSA